MIKGLADLVFPHDPAVLLDAIRDARRTLLRTSQSKQFQSLLPWSTAWSLVTLDGLIHGEVRAIRKGVDIPIEMLTTIDRDVFRRKIEPRQLQALCRTGLSLVLNKVSTSVPTIAALCAMVERRVGVRATANCYISCQRDSAFRAHWDGHDVLVLQLRGRKRWRFFGHQERFPLKPRQFPGDPAGEAEWTHVMEPGDVLYVPRGDIHVTSVEAGESMHLTISLKAPRGDDLVQWLAERSRDEELFRRDIHPLAGRDALRQRESELRSALHELVDRIDLDRFLADEDRTREPAPSFNIGAEDLISSNVWVQPTLRRIPDFPAEDGSAWTIGKQKMALTGEERAVITVLLERDAARVGELGGMVPGLTPDQVTVALLDLARKSLIFLLEENE